MALTLLMLKGFLCLLIYSVHVSLSGSGIEGYDLQFGLKADVF